MSDVTFGDLRRAVANAVGTVPDGSPIKVNIFQADLFYMSEVSDAEARINWFGLREDGRMEVDLVVELEEAVWAAFDGTTAFAARDGDGRLHVYTDRHEAERIGHGECEEATIHVQ